MTLSLPLHASSPLQELPRMTLPLPLHTSTALQESSIKLSLPLQASSPLHASATTAFALPLQASSPLHALSPMIKSLPLQALSPLQELSPTLILFPSQASSPIQELDPISARTIDIEPSINTLIKSTDKKTFCRNSRFNTISSPLFDQLAAPFDFDNSDPYHFCD